MTKTDSSSTPTLKNNQQISIATANHRQAKTWKNQLIDISGFSAKLHDPVRTKETVAEYGRMNKADQDRIKDVGGFVGGALKGGQRRKDCVANRQLITLDLDYALEGATETIKRVLADTCHTVYSTHKHTPERPRLRLIVYPDRPMMPGEYQPVARRIAQAVGIDWMDDTTYDINRLFYWPSCPSDGQYLFWHNDAPLLSVDKVLKSYGMDEDGRWELWKDATQWPASSREPEIVRQMISRQADPMTKPGIVGAWCRNVSIHDAIAQYLPGAYNRIRDGNRYTYTGGSTVGGAVIYDDKFLYSNHATDPAHGHARNAWDIVRVHRFGGLDDKVKADTPANRTPSFLEMERLAMGLAAVKADMIKQGLGMDATEDDFDSFGLDEASGEDWTHRLQATSAGSIKPTWANLSIILEHDPKVNKCIKFNEFSFKAERGESGEQWTDADSGEAKDYLGKTYSVDFGAAKVDDVLQFHAWRRRYHPVREYLDGLTWDGKPRVERLWAACLGTPYDAYHRDTARCWCVAAVKRIFEPGTKFDFVVVISGAQGIGKSTFVQTLGRGWYGQLSTFDHKMAMEEVTGRWIVEMGELAAMSRQEMEHQKAFLSSQSTTVRMAYAHYPTDFKRQCVFIGTTNSKEYLKDDTGNRRWWPVDVADGITWIDIDGLRVEVDQIWAEAVSLYKGGAECFLRGEAAAAAAEMQQVKRISDPWEGIILAWLDSPARVDRYDRDRIDSDYTNTVAATEARDRVCVAEIWEDCLNMRYESRPADRRRIASIVDQAKGSGWSRTTTSRFGTRFGIQKGWSNSTSKVSYSVLDGGYVPF